jgi:hypothetical protein
MVGNVMSNTIKDPDTFDGRGELGLDAGLLLVVQNVMQDGMVPVAEIATTGLHYFYGTFRAGIKTTNVSGTCSAFFWVCVQLVPLPYTTPTRRVFCNVADELPYRSTKTTRKKLTSSSSPPSTTRPTAYFR